jgi:hypothetical protein
VVTLTASLFAPSVPKTLVGTQALRIKVDNRWTEVTKGFATEKRLHDAIARSVEEILYGVKEAAEIARTSHGRGR